MKYLITIPGILTDQNDPAAWFRVFAAAFDRSPDSCGIPYSYFATVAGAPASLNRMADELARLIIRTQALAEAELLDVVTHSHGAAILLAALQRHPEARVRRWVGIASAVDVDCDTNGLNEAVAAGQLASVTLLDSPNDAVLAGPGTLPGYGQLGLRGPSNASPQLASVLTVELFQGNHSDYFNDDNIARTLQIVGGM